MTTFYIFRHGATFASKRRISYGWLLYNAHILEEGKGAVKKLGEYLKDVPSDFNVSSPVLRCRETVEIIEKESNKKFIFDKRLTEYSLESYGHFTGRIQNLLDEVKEKKYKNVVICTHAAVMVVLFKLLRGENFKVSDLDFLPETGILNIIDDKQFKQIDFNKPSKV